MTAETGLIACAAAAAFAYGVFLILRASWPLKALARLLALAGLLAVTILDAAPIALMAGVGFAVIAEAVLAGRSRWRIPLGLTAMLASNLAYAWLFCRYGAGPTALAAEGWRAVGAFGAPALAAMLLTGVWAGLADYKAIIAVNAAVSGVTAAAAFTLPHAFWTAMPGAVLVLVASTPAARLAIDTQRREGLGALIWATGLIGQALIAYAILF